MSICVLFLCYSFFLATVHTLYVCDLCMLILYTALVARPYCPPALKPTRSRCKLLCTITCRHTQWNFFFLRIFETWLWPNTRAEICRLYKKDFTIYSCVLTLPFYSIYSLHNGDVAPKDYFQNNEPLHCPREPHTISLHFTSFHFTSIH
jgi:hypothetical protein